MAIECANDKYFGVLIFLCQQVTCKRKSNVIIVTDVNMTSKLAFLQKVTLLLNSAKKRGNLNKSIVFDVFLSQRLPRIKLSAKCK